VDREYILAKCEFYRCPNSGEVVIAPRGGSDNKVMCRCGKTTPELVAMGRTEAMTGGWVHHFKSSLEGPSDLFVDQYIEQGLALIAKVAAKRKQRGEPNV